MGNLLLVRQLGGAVFAVSLVLGSANRVGKSFDTPLLIWLCLFLLLTWLSGCQRGTAADGLDNAVGSQVAPGR